MLLRTAVVSHGRFESDQSCKKVEHLSWAFGSLLPESHVKGAYRPHVCCEA